jgi:hypothetical protein
MAGLLPPGTQIIERGALDDVTPGDLGRMTPAAGDTVLVTRLRSGAEVRLAEARLGPFLRRAAAELRGQGADLVAVLCTGTLAGTGWPGPVLLPGPIVRGLATAMTTRGSRLAVLVPAADQQEDARAEWASLTVGDDHIRAVPAPHRDRRVRGLQPLAAGQHAGRPHLLSERAERGVPARPFFRADHRSLVMTDQQRVAHDAS